MKTFSAKTKANPAFKRVQPLPMLAGVASPEDEAWLAAARKPGVHLIPSGCEFPLHPASGRAAWSSGLRSPGEVSNRGNALAISAWAGSGRFFA